MTINWNTWNQTNRILFKNERTYSELVFREAQMKT